MTAKEIQKRNKKAEQLRVIQVDDETFYVESSDGKICYRVSRDVQSCQCGDFAKNIKTNPDHKCKHILAVMNSIPTGEFENGQILEKNRVVTHERACCPSPPADLPAPTGQSRDRPQGVVCGQ